MELDLEDILAAQQSALRATLRTKYPFLKVDELDKMLKEASKVILDRMEQQAATMKESMERFDFLQFPGELRNRIYEYVLEEPRSSCVQAIELHRQREGMHRVMEYGSISWKPSAISQVNRQLREETLSIYYGRNKFVAYVDPDKKPNLVSPIILLESWLMCIGKERAKLIKRLTIKMPLPEDDCTWNDEHCDEHNSERRKSPRGVWMPRTVRDIGRRFELNSLGVADSAIRGLFGAHTKYYDDEDNDRPYKGDVWHSVMPEDYNEDLTYLWWSHASWSEPS